MELSEFLLARIAEDEAAAGRAIRWSEGVSQWADAGQPDWEHIARWDPARVLAECEAKRRIVKELATTRDVVAEMPSGSGRLAARYGLDAMLRLLALPYADHPDYRSEWAP